LPNGDRKTELSEVVVDASAILALLNQEKGSEEVARFMGKAAISSVNLSEVIAKLADLNIPEDVIAEILSNLRLEVIPLAKLEDKVWGIFVLFPF
jgi:PIN domain nuclease of toxin-antitoxin system